MAKKGPTGIFNVKMDEYLTKAPELTAEPLGEGLWVASGDDYNALFAEVETGIVVFNTLGTPGAAGALLELVERTIPGKPIETLVVTTDHLDHAGYGDVLAPGAEIVGHELTARVISGRRASGQSAITHEIRGDAESLKLDGIQVQLLYPGPTQGTGNLWAHFPQQRVLFGVGPRADARYGLFADYHFARYEDSIRSLLELDFDVLVPGRGPAMDRAGLERSVDYVEALKEACQHAFAGGEPIWVIQAMQPYVSERLGDRFGDLDGFEEHVGIGAIRVVHHYLMGGWGLEDTHEPELMLAAAS